MTRGFRPKKALLKRIKITGKGKFLRRNTGMDHFEAKDSGKLKRKDRKEFFLSKPDGKVAKKLLPL